MPEKDKPIIDALTENVMRTRFEDIPADVIDNTKRRILDMLGCAIGGAAGPGNQGLVEVVKNWGGRPQATILGYGVKTSPQSAALANCIFGRTFDRGPLTLIIDGKRSPSHITETTVLTALAIGEPKNISGRELMTSIIVGDDLSARLQVATERPQPGQALPPGSPPVPATRGTTDIFGAAAIAGRLLGLSLEQLKSAFGLAVIMQGGGGSVAQAGWHGQDSGTEGGGGPSRGWLGVKDPFFMAQVAKGGYEETVSVKLNQGLIARNGIDAAELARAGWTGARDAFFSERGGYYPGLASCNSLHRVTDGLGQRYHTEQVFKPYPGGKPTHAPTDAAIAVARNNDINTDEIAEVILHLSPPATAAHYAKTYMLGEYPTMNALWSYYFAVASALVRRNSIDKNYTEESIRDPKVQSLIPKVKLGDLDKPRGVEVEVKMKDGRVFSEYAPIASGEPSNPMTREALIAKFMEQVEFSGMVSRQNAEKLIELVDRIETVTDVCQITQLAAGSAK